MPWWGSLGSYRYPWLIAWLVPTWSVVWSCALCCFAVPVMSWVGRSIGETLARMMSQTRISSRYRMHCSSRLWFSCQAWKSCMGSPLPHLALGRGGGGMAALLMRLVCWTGWVVCQVINWGDRKSFVEPHSTCLVRAMWSDWQWHVSEGSCTFCYSCHDL